MDSAQETYATFSISVCPTRALTPVSPAQTGGHRTSTSEAHFMPRRSLHIECDQGSNRPLFHLSMLCTQYTLTLIHALTLYL